MKKITPKRKTKKKIKEFEPRLQLTLKTVKENFKRCENSTASTVKMPAIGKHGLEVLEFKKRLLFGYNRKLKKETYSRYWCLEAGDLRIINDEPIAE